MKNTIFFTIAFTALTNISCSYSKNNNDNSFFGNSIISTNNSGKGPIVDKTYTFDFDEISTSNSLNVEIVKAHSEKIVVSAPDDIINKIAVEQNGDKLFIKVADGIRNLSTDRVKVVVYAKDFKKLHASSSSSIIVRDLFLAESMEVSASSSASIVGDFDNRNIAIQISSSADYEGEVKAENLTLQSTSSGQIRLRGRANQTNAQCSSSASILGSEFVTKSATLAASSSASIKIGVSESLVGTASSSGSVFAIKKGNLANVTVKESSSGSVTVK